jgi:hypothetical protein
MGVSLSWIGVETLDADELHAKLGVSRTSAAGHFYDFPMAGLLIAGNRCLLTAKGCEHPIISERVLRDLSAGTSVIACSIEEHVMFQSSALWRDGREIWRVLHRGGDHGAMDLVVSGQPPAAFRRYPPTLFLLAAC